jgi:group I intron endonuclease
MATAIYAIVNQHTKDMYVGSAVDTKRRWRTHSSQLRNNKHHCQHLQNAYAKHGAEAFDWEIIEYVEDKNNLIQREQVWIDFFKPAYNKRTIADSCLGLKRSPESRLKMSLAQKGKKQSIETIAKRAQSLKGRARPIDVRAKISASHFGIVPNEATRKKMSESAKRRVK